MRKTNKIQLAGVPAAVALFGALVGATGCGENPLDALCCADFKPGTNMLEVDWGLEGKANAEFGVAIQAIGDFSAAASAMVTDLGTVCRNMAVELGTDPKAVDTADPREFTAQWCGFAATAITDLKAEAQLTISIQEPKCSFSAEVQASCEGSCQVDASCDPGSIEARCDPGELSVKCSGSCSGSCEGSANVSVSCEGSCEGKCEGSCSGSTDSGGVCNGTCSGKCRGTCSAQAGAMVACEGECTGGCEGTATAPKCKAELTPPSCEASADCQASCKASASAKAECTPPAVAISATGDANIQQKVAVLEKYLPELAVIAQARAELLLGNAEALIEVSGNLDASLEGDGKAVLCIIPAITAIADAGDNLNVAVTASVDVFGTVSGS
jgi:hypothetical protein